MLVCETLRCRSLSLTTNAGHCSRAVSFLSLSDACAFRCWYIIPCLGRLIFIGNREVVRGGTRMESGFYLNSGTTCLLLCGKSYGRRLEVVAEGLCLFGGCQLAFTVVSTLHGDGTHRRKADVEDGVALKEARRRKRPHARSCVEVMEEHDLWSL